MMLVIVGLMEDLLIIISRFIRMTATN